MPDAANEICITNSPSLISHNHLSRLFIRVSVQFVSLSSFFFSLVAMMTNEA